MNIFILLCKPVQFVFYLPTLVTLHTIFYMIEVQKVFHNRAAMIFVGSIIPVIRF